MKQRSHAPGRRLIRFMAACVASTSAVALCMGFLIPRLSLPGPLLGLGGAVLCALLLALWHMVFLAPLAKDYAALCDTFAELAQGNLDGAPTACAASCLPELARCVASLGTSLNAYIQDISAVLARLSAGDMTVAPSERCLYSSDFMPIKNALTKISRSLNQSFSQISAMVGELSCISANLQSSGALLAEGAATQSSDIAALTEVISDIDRHTAQNAKSAELAAAGARSAMEQTHAGDEYIRQMVDAMNGIAQASNNISSILSLIDSIAFQTNVLALNASVEAARAGSAGKGFAVVAGEVKNLALKSAQAARQTGELLRDNAKKIEDGSKLANRTAAVFEQIRSAVDHTAELSGQIAELSRRQAQDVRKTSTLLLDISQIAQNNAAGAEESAAVSDQLNTQAEQLAQLMHRYRLGSADAETERRREEQMDTAAHTLMNMLRKALANTSKPCFDELLQQAADRVAGVECLYLIAPDGRQASATVLSSGAAQSVCEGFTPAKSGDDHSRKKYFIKALAQKGGLYRSGEYVSGATGGLCRTYASLAPSSAGGVVICIDMQCLI